MLNHAMVGVLNFNLHLFCDDRLFHQLILYCTGVESSRCWRKVRKGYERLLLPLNVLHTACIVLHVSHSNLQWSIIYWPVAVLPYCIDPETLLEVACCSNNL